LKRIEIHATEKKIAEITDNNARLRPDPSLHQNPRAHLRGAVNVSFVECN